MERNDLVKVDIFDNELGVVTKAEAHAKPILHRAFSVFLINNNNQMLIQKRAPHKYHSPNLWANACCSHPRKGENVVESAENRLVEELGFTTKVEEIFKFVYLNKFNDNLFEYELDHVLIGNYNGDIVLNLEEASEFKWIDLKELSEDLVNNPQNYSSWFIIAAPKVIEFLKVTKNLTI